MPTTSQGGHSADVKMNQLRHGTSIPVVQLGPDSLLLETASEELPGETNLVLGVDRNELSWCVNLPDGITTASKRVAIAGAV